MSRVLYRCPTPTNVLCPCGAVERRLRKLELEHDDPPGPLPAPARPEIEELTRQQRVPVLVDGDEVIPDSKRILEYLEWKYQRARDAVPALTTGCALESEAMNTPESAVTITDSAAGKIRDLVAANEAEQALRVAVKGGGCSGFQYALALDAPKTDDHVFEQNGVAVVVDKVSMQFVFGSEVDYVDGLQGAGSRSTTRTWSPPAAAVLVPGPRGRGRAGRLRLAPEHPAGPHSLRAAQGDRRADAVSRRLVQARARRSDDALRAATGAARRRSCARSRVRRASTPARFRPHAAPAARSTTNGRPRSQASLREYVGEGLAWIAEIEQELARLERRMADGDGSRDDPGAVCGCPGKARARGRGTAGATASTPPCAALASTPRSSTGRSPASRAAS